MSSYVFINKKNLLLLSRGVYFSLGLVILYRFLFVESANQGLIAAMFFFFLGFPLSLVWTCYMFFPLFFIDLILGGAIKALPDFFQTSLVVLACLVNFCAGYWQWFVIVPKWISEFKNRRVTRH